MHSPNSPILDSALFESCCAKITQIRNWLGVSAASLTTAPSTRCEPFPPIYPTATTSSPSPMKAESGEDISWYALLLIVPLSLLGLMLGMTHHVLLFVAAMCENVLRSWCSQWMSLKESKPKPEQYLLFCVISAPIMMVLASAWIALTACCHLNRLFLSNVPEDLNNFINNKLIHWC